MNELIERLAMSVIDKSKDAPEYDSGWLMDDEELEAFAKAVARECAEIARTTYTNADAYASYRAIKERFGL